MLKRTHSPTQSAPTIWKSSFQILPRESIKQVCDYLTLNEKVILKSTTNQWFTISFSMLESVIIHIVTTVIESNTDKPLFSYNPKVGLVFECQRRKPSGQIRAVRYALDLQTTSEWIYLRRYDQKFKRFEFLTYLCGTVERHSYIMPTMSYFLDQEHANFWMKQRLLEIFHEISLLTAIAPGVFK